MKRQYYLGISIFITIVILILDQITKIYNSEFNESWRFFRSDS
ncbi:lipoprotein signal peptidase [Staphylococcus gallinarum]|uniref:Lipoprotein signal peptidase n=1 Tax=Staphylococcus gallinarum TaxID=1293 RepID=A0A380FGM1_STAGA|nr:lipoprotein signal peptidase [Staphylococcus gallinarum]